MWNYRIVRKRHVRVDPLDQKERVDYTYGVHEAFYDKNGYVGTITEDPIEPFGENIEELRHSWVMMAEAFGQPILDCDNIPEPGYDRTEDPMGSALDARLAESETGDPAGIPWEEVKEELEEKWGPFDEEGYRRHLEEERVEKEKIHGETFVGTPTLTELIRKMFSDYQEYIKRDKAENPSKYSAEDVQPLDDVGWCIMETNYLKAVFWDYPEMCDPQGLEKALRQARADNDRETLRWIMARFLERGRFRDAAASFPKEEVRDNLDALKISGRARQKWKRFLEFYGALD